MTKRKSTTIKKTNIMSLKKKLTSEIVEYTNPPKQKQLFKHIITEKKLRDDKQNTIISTLERAIVP